MSVNYRAVEQWITPGSRVLDLGCGEGDLLQELRHYKNVSGLGVDIDPDNITACIKKQISVVEQDLDGGLNNFSDNSFDTVLLTQTLQAVHHPDYVLQEMLRVGKECIISFPNFGHWQARFYLATRGKMPVSKFMPYQWYDTPNIHFCTVRDFEVLCQNLEIQILNRKFLRANAAEATRSLRLANLFAVNAIYHVTR